MCSLTLTQNSGKLVCEQASLNGPTKLNASHIGRFAYFLESFILYIVETRSIVPAVSKSTFACIDIDLNQFGLVIAFLLWYGLIFYHHINSVQLGRQPHYSDGWREKNTEGAPCTYSLHLHVILTAQSAWVKLERKLPKHVKCLSFKTLAGMKQKRKESRGGLASSSWLRPLKAQLRWRAYCWEETCNRIPVP